MGLYGFSFNDCSVATAPLKGNISLTPNNPVTLPGKLNVSFNASFGVTLKSPLKLVLYIQKKVSGRTKLLLLLGIARVFLEQQQNVPNRLETFRKRSFINNSIVVIILVNTVFCINLMCYFAILKPMQNIGKVSVNASILYKNQEICNKTNLWKFQLISLFRL